MRGGDCLAQRRRAVNEGEGPYLNVKTVLSTEVNFYGCLWMNSLIQESLGRHHRFPKGKANSDEKQIQQIRHSQEDRWRRKAGLLPALAECPGSRRTLTVREERGPDHPRPGHPPGFRNSLFDSENAGLFCVNSEIRRH